MKKLALFCITVIPTTLFAPQHHLPITATTKQTSSTFTDKEIEGERQRILDALPLDTCATMILRNPDEEARVRALIKIANEEAQEARNRFWNALKRDPNSHESKELLRRYLLFENHETPLFKAALQKQFDILAIISKAREHINDRFRELEEKIKKEQAEHDARHLALKATVEEGLKNGRTLLKQLEVFNQKNSKK